MKTIEIPGSLNFMNWALECWPELKDVQRGSELGEALRHKLLSLNVIILPSVVKCKQPFVVLGFETDEDYTQFLLTWC